MAIKGSGSLVPSNAWLLFSVIFLALPLSISQAQSANVSHAVVVIPATADIPERQAARTLVEEVAKRTGISWNIREQQARSTETDCTPCIELGREDQLRGDALPNEARKPESFRVDAVSPAHIEVAGADDRGVLYGVGFLLRRLALTTGHAALPAQLRAASSPQFAIRGHQLGYRAKNNTYDAWTPQQFEQYIRDLAVFGANTIELLPPRTDDAPSSPLFHLPPLEMMKRVSAIVKSYGLRCSVFYPTLAKDYRDPRTIASELQAWGEVFRALPQIDEVFVPAGDPGNTDPAVLFPFLAQVATVLHESHPLAGLWVSAQGLNEEEMTRFYSLVNARPAWLSGVVVGPQSRHGLETQRSRIDPALPIRFYPDIGHTMHAQLPLDNWDEAFALTEGREVINPRPRAEADIFRHFAASMKGFVTYSEGVNDDVNKFIWTALGWSEQAEVSQILDEYADYFIGGSGFPSNEVARGLLDLEENWNGPLMPHEAVDATLRAFQRMERTASKQQADNWRFEEALFRAYTDAYERQRLIGASDREQEAMRRLAAAAQTGSLQAMANAEAALRSDAEETRRLQPWREKIGALGAQLYVNIGLQLSVVNLGASAVDRGATLDTLDVSLNDGVWLHRQFARIRSLTDEQLRLRELDAIVRWMDPGPGGFYDDLGNPVAEPHLVRGPGTPADPALFLSAHDGIADVTPDQGWRTSAISYAGAHYDHPLELRYDHIDPAARYKIRVTYAGEEYKLPITLVANGKYLVHGPRLRANNPETVEFPIPQDATREGRLDLQWTRPPGMGGGGRGFQVAEVWIMREDE